VSDQLTANKRRKNQTLRPLEEPRGIGHPKIQPERLRHPRSRVSSERLALEQFFILLKPEPEFGANRSDQLIQT